jgi:hypothetical protein
MAIYRYFAADLLAPTGLRQIRASLPLSGVAYSEIWNRAGQLQATIDLRSPKATRAILDPGRTVIIVERDGVLAWAGPLWSATPTMDGKATLQARGFHSYLEGASSDTGRFVSHRLSTSDASLPAGQCAMARVLWVYAQNEGLHGPGANLGINIPAGPAGVTRDRTWEPWEHQNIGKLLVDLSEVDDGINFRFEHRWSNGSPVTDLVVTEGLPARTPYVWKLGRNILELDCPIDATGMARRVWMLGEGQNAEQKQVVRSTLTPGWPLIETVDRSHTTVSDLGTLAGWADEQLRRRATAAVLPRIKVLAGPDPRLGSWRPGDEVQVVAKLPGTPPGGLLDLAGYYRIAGWTVTVEDPGPDRDRSSPIDDVVAVELAAAA